ncbi:aminodeoxychorismate synthase, component I [Haloarculaceae archaeon H-GB2-1]|nr:aminodeoxychorismate synthase, component I [Haloarculaceae archaeon H-GB1-1]MEA5389068.1 aminodeoxychorismate synthase, component I [Haloarculaceae archaeon H-GB11]MEA5407129.1 aminodeoxychorismate synthase, component I [Haloarculaceae archaeon H-GB2-1]
MGTPHVVTEFEEFEATATDAPAGARVPVEVTTTVADPFVAYRRARDGPGGFYLETTGGQDGWGYFGVEPVSRVQVGPDATPLEDGSHSLGEVDSLLETEELARGDCEVPYPCGAFGWLSYDVARELEALPDTTVNERELPRLQLGVFETVAAWEEPCADDDEVTLHVTACPTVDDDVEAAYERAREDALALATAAGSGEASMPDTSVEASTAEFESECGADAFTERVHQVKHYIREGDTFQANISHRLTAPAVVHPVQAFSVLRDINPAPYSGLLEFPGIDLVSASPELLLYRDGDYLETEPIAGTRPRGSTPEEDDELEADLLSDEKERAEHAMLVDLERNDLGKVSEYGSVNVSEYRRVDRYSEVMHLVSLVEGRLRDGATLGDAVAAVFPGGTITGAPKPRTMEIIDEVERSRRGPYTGSMGVFGFDGTATLNIVIRTLARTDDQYSLRVGAGIVHDSVPDREYAETLDKARALVTAFDEALGETAEFAVETPGQ